MSVLQVFLYCTSALIKQSHDDRGGGVRSGSIRRARPAL